MCENEIAVSLLLCFWFWWKISLRMEACFFSNPSSVYPFGGPCLLISSTFKTKWQTPIDQSVFMHKDDNFSLNRAIITKWHSRCVLTFLFNSGAWSLTSCKYLLTRCPVSTISSSVNSSFRRIFWIWKAFPLHLYDLKYFNRS